MGYWTPIIGAGWYCSVCGQFVPVGATHPDHLNVPEPPSYVTLGV